MELVWVIYCIEVLTNIKMWGLVDLFIATAIIIPLVGVVIVGIWLGLENLNFAHYIKNVVFRKIVIIPVLLVFGFGSLFNALMPSRETAYIMLGVYGVQSVAETLGKNEDVQNIGKSTLKLVNSAIEKYQSELDQNQKKVESSK